MIAATIPLAILLMPGQHAAAQTAAQRSQHRAGANIALRCIGTSKEIGGTDHDLWPDHQILGVNIADQTVTGLGIVARIDRVDPDSVSFSGEGPFDRRVPKFGTVAVAGTLDRLTGAASVLQAVFSGSGLTKEIVLRVSYICKVI
jgi:hypothetical protein